MSVGEVVKFRSIKPEIRVVGIDDGYFTPRQKGSVAIVGVVFRGGYWLDGVMRTEIEVDGLGATIKITNMITDSPHYNQLRVVFLNGITFAGFNVVDITKLYRNVGLPVIAVTRKRPNLKEIKKALKNVSGFEKKWLAIKNAGRLIKVQTKKAEGSIYMQIAGISESDAEKILIKTSTRSNIPEALRVAHIIVSGLTRLKEKI